MREVNSVDPMTVTNPATGLFYRNPTHLDEAKRARSQTDIVNSIIGTGREIAHDTLDYSDPDVTEFPGFRKLLQPNEEGGVNLLDDQTILSLCKNFLRSRPNIYGFRISYGNYTLKKLENTKTRALSSRYQRFQTEIGEALSEVLSDKNMRVVEVVYTVSNTAPGNFIATAEVYATT